MFTGCSSAHKIDIKTSHNPKLLIGRRIVKMIKDPAIEEVYWQGISVDAEDSELVSELLTRVRVFARGMSEFGFLQERINSCIVSYIFARLV